MNALTLQTQSTLYAARNKRHERADAIDAIIGAKGELSSGVERGILDPAEHERRGHGVSMRRVAARVGVQEVGMAPYVERNTQGTLMVAGSRVSVGSVVRAFWTGETPETICQAYPTLSLEQIYGAIAYYLAHRPEVDAEIATYDTEVTRLREAARMRNADLRSRLIAAQPARP